MSRKNLVFVADTHIMHNLAVCPPTLVLSNGSMVSQHPLRDKIWQHWCHFWDYQLPKWIGDEKFIVVVNGDLIEGYTNRILSFISTNPADFTLAGAALLRPIIERSNCAGLILITGTDVHVGIEGFYEHQVFQILAASNRDKLLGIFNRKTLRVNGVSISVAHHISGSYRSSSRGTPLAVELAETNVNYALAGESPPDIIIRGHSHIYREYTYNNQTVITLPAWCLVTHHAINRIPTARTDPTLATLGGILLQIDDDGEWIRKKYLHKIKDDDLVMEL